MAWVTPRGDVDVGGTLLCSHRCPLIKPVLGGFWGRLKEAEITPINCSLCLLFPCLITGCLDWEVQVLLLEHDQNKVRHAVLPVVEKGYQCLLKEAFFLFWSGLALDLPSPSAGRGWGIPAYRAPASQVGLGSPGTEKWLNVDQKVVVLNTSHFKAAVSW